MMDEINAFRKRVGQRERAIGQVEAWIRVVHGVAIFGVIILALLSLAYLFQPMWFLIMLPPACVLACVFMITKSHFKVCEVLTSIHDDLGRLRREVEALKTPAEPIDFPDVDRDLIDFVNDCRSEEV